MTITFFNGTAVAREGHRRHQGRSIHGTMLDSWHLSDVPKPTSENGSVFPSTRKLDGEMGYSANWYGGLTSYEQVDNMLRDGWREGAQSVAKLSDMLESLPEMEQLGVSSRRRKPSWSDQGDEICVDRLYGGQLDTMWRTTTRSASGILPIVSIVFAWGGLANRTAEQLIWSGAAAIAIASKLEVAGYSVELIAQSIAYQYDRSELAATGVRIKASDTPLDVGSLAAVACHPAVFRTKCFQYRCTTGAKIGGGFGSTTDASNLDLPASGWELEGAPLQMPLVYSKDEAIASVRAVLKEGMPLIGGAAFDGAEQRS